MLFPLWHHYPSRPHLELGLANFEMVELTTRGDVLFLQVFLDGEEQVLLFDLILFRSSRRSPFSIVRKARVPLTWKELLSIRVFLWTLHLEFALLQRCTKRDSLQVRIPVHIVMDYLGRCAWLTKIRWRERPFGGSGDLRLILNILQQTLPCLHRIHLLDLFAFTRIFLFKRTSVTAEITQILTVAVVPIILVWAKCGPLPVVVHTFTVCNLSEILCGTRESWHCIPSRGRCALVTSSYGTGRLVS